MMKKLCLGIAALALVAFASAADLRSQVEAMNKQVRAAFLKKDVDAFVRVVKPEVTKDFKYTEDGKSYDFNQMVSQMRMSFMQMSKITQVGSTLLTVTEKGDIGICKASESMSGLIRDPKTKKTHTMEYHGVSTYRFKKMGGKWMMSAMTASTSSMTMDGKPMKM